MIFFLLKKLILFENAANIKKIIVYHSLKTTIWLCQEFVYK